MTTAIEKVHLGDGAYVEYQGYTFVLTTNNGIQDTNTIYLEIREMKALIDYASKLIRDR